MKEKLPALFIGHGSPMNAVLDNSYTRMLGKLGESFERPEAILVVSAHWQTRGTYITGADKPRQIYDFYGFPEELYNIKYEPKGSKKYCEIILQELNDEDIKSTDSWGLDHAAWAVLLHMYPKADIPVIEMSLNVLGDEEYHYNLGKKLYKLREKGILIIGSGNIVHNLMEMEQEIDANPYNWAMEFDEYVRVAINNNEYKKLIDYKEIRKVAQLALPTNEHYLPLLYVEAMQGEDDSVNFIHEGIQNASISMRCVRIG
ncbi:4,5-DOPA dioxygenase extradiol [Clostridium arbusti]|uniref:4,5-DOPA-extradiol-dioxygenase n=1 Tax=Clostridium arbusti TaxID=1137848 RepID=UPI0002893F94|nr:4,5-DOPA dioxygenase extradiol [Clostridium arbusti]